MYAYVTPAPAAAALTPVGVASTGPPVFGGAVKTSFSVRRATLNVLAGHPATVAGALLGSEGLPHPDVMLQALESHGWSVVARARTGAAGGFALRYVPRRTGSERVRLRFAGDAYDLGAQRPLGRLNVYRQVEASWYGGEGSLACGGWLTPTTLGVASRTLPCGTEVTLRYQGRSLQVPVVDRGPYVAGREFDLTEATRQALGFGDTGEVWSTR